MLVGVSPTTAKIFFPALEPSVHNNFFLAFGFPTPAAIWGKRVSGTAVLVVVFLSFVFSLICVESQDSAPLYLVVTASLSLLVNCYFFTYVLFAFVSIVKGERLNTEGGK